MGGGLGSEENRGEREGELGGEGGGGHHHLPAAWLFLYVITLCMWRWGGRGKKGGEAPPSCSWAFPVTYHMVYVALRVGGVWGMGFTIRVSKFCLTPGAQHGGDNGELEAKLEVLHSGGHLEGVVVELAIKAAGHNLDEGGALAHEHVVDQACTVTSNLHHRMRMRVRIGLKVDVKVEKRQRGVCGGVGGGPDGEA